MATPKENADAGERLWNLYRKGFFDWLRQTHNIERPRYPTDIFEKVGFERTNEFMSEFDNYTKNHLYSIEEKPIGCTCSMADPLKCEACQKGV